MLNPSLVEQLSTKKLRNKKDAQEANKSCTALTKTPECVKIVGQKRGCGWCFM